HAFGPDDPYSMRILRHVDNTISKIATARRDGYELVVLSDHGQIDTIPFGRVSDKAFGELVAGWLPGYRVQETKGKAFGPPEDEAKGRVNLTNSGALSHVYFVDRAQRFIYSELTAQCPGLAQNIAAID